MNEFLAIINVVAAIGATIISTITLFTTKKLQTMQQKVNIMANKRSDRIDLMRSYSAQVLSNAKTFLYGINKEENKFNLLSAVDNFNSLLQYEYPYDIELIDIANEILNLCLANNDKEELQVKIKSFWKKCDIYVGVEYERLKKEAQGTFNKSGEVKGESNTFEEIYKKLLAQQNEILSQEK